MKLNKKLAIDYLKSGFRVFETDSSDGAILVIKHDPAIKQKFLKIGLRPTLARLETNTYSVPFKQPHPLLDIKVKVIKELFI